MLYIWESAERKHDMDRELSIKILFRYIFMCSPAANVI